MSLLGHHDIIVSRLGRPDMSRALDMSTASGLIQSLRTEILKEGESGGGSGTTKLTEDEQCQVCSILCTGEGLQYLLLL